jgi:uncharacterized membrane protein (UPF0127 family)
MAIFVLFFFFFLKATTPKVCFRKNCLKVDIADTLETRSNGLMHRRHLPSGQGMLFIFPKEDYWSFWMKNTLIPLDIIWMDAKGRIVDMIENAQPVSGGEVPPGLKPVFKALYVLEANAGFVREHHLRHGDQARFQWIFSR